MSDDTQKAPEPAKAEIPKVSINVPPPPPIPDASEKVKAMLESAAVANGAGSGGGIKGVIGRCWRGEERLVKAFWLYGVLPSIVLNIIFNIIGGMLGAIGPLVSFVLLLPFAIWNMVSVWRCAWNAGAKFWGVIVRILVVLGAIGTVFTAFAAVMAIFVGDNTTSSPFPMSGNAPVAAPQEMIAPVAPVAPPQEAMPAAPAPITAPTPAPTPVMDACEQRMHDYAVQNNADPAAYIAQNQAYLGECRKALGAQPKP